MSNSRHWNASLRPCSPAVLVDGVKKQHFDTKPNSSGTVASSCLLYKGSDKTHFKPPPSNGKKSVLQISLQRLFLCWLKLPKWKHASIWAIGCCWCCCCEFVLLFLKFSFHWLSLECLFPQAVENGRGWDSESLHRKVWARKALPVLTQNFCIFSALGT